MIVNKHDRIYGVNILIGLIEGHMLYSFQKYIARKSKGGVICFFDKIFETDFQTFQWCKLDYSQIKLDHVYVLYFADNYYC